MRFEALALATLGHFAEAFARLDESIERIEATGERWFEAEIYRLRGEINQQSNGSRDDRMRTSHPRLRQ